MAASAPLWLLGARDNPSNKVVVALERGCRSVKTTQHSDVCAHRRAPLSRPAGFKHHHIGVERSDAEGRVDARHDRLVGQHSVCQEHADESLSAVAFAQASPGDLEEAVVSRTEAPRRTGLGQGGGSGEGAGLGGQGLEVVVQFEDLEPLADGTSVMGDDASGVESFDAFGIETHLNAACRLSAPGPSRSSGARTPGSWRRHAA